MADDWTPITADIARITLRPDGEHPQEGRQVYDHGLTGRFRTVVEDGRCVGIDVDIEYNDLDGAITGHGASGQAIGLEWWARDGKSWVQSVAPLLRWQADQAMWRGKGSQVWPGPDFMNPQAHWWRTLDALPEEVAEQVSQSV